MNQSLTPPPPFFFLNCIMFLFLSLILVQQTNVYVGNVYVLGVAICPSYPIIRHGVMYVEVGVVTGSRVLIPAAHCFRGSAREL